ncbi:capsid cement protein [Tersicoccus sp. Bi-70]|uniref:capsid cement protein n=1 Tax=Tersicoccus sp. Bi-70 TaxID=1897634 RepID=UPI0009770F30|nr:capsid cement protein [Tersicoccus sp. Bi-70]OMH30646.1 DUF2190 domain-containing protein [Tersicoccus sp. Bi-70]
MADYLPLFRAGESPTHAVSAAVTGGQLVEVTGDRVVGPATADSAKVVGVASADTPLGERVAVFRGGVQRLTASGAIAAGDRVAAAADGKVSTTGTNKIGTALAAAADGALAPIQMDR